MAHENKQNDTDDKCNSNESCHKLCSQWLFCFIYVTKVFLSSLQICRALISSLMNCYLDDSASIDAISERLRDVCPSLFSNDDAVSTKVNTS